MDDEQIAEHKQAFERASAIVMSEIPTYERHNLPKPGWWTRHKLKRALSLFARVLELRPDNWSAMWLVGKVHQRSGNNSEALSWFERSYQINSSQPDVAREASLCAMDVGLHDPAIRFAHRAVQIEPENAGLHANLALAILLSGRVAEARPAIEQALKLNPSDQISRTIDAIIRTRLYARGSRCNKYCGRNSRCNVHRRNNCRFQDHSLPRDGWNR